MLNNMSLKQTSVFMVVLLLIAGSVSVGSSLYINAEMRTVKNTWTEFQVVRSEKARLGGQLRASLGYGGMIHNLKNYILRGGDSLTHEIRAQLGGARTVLDQYGLQPLNATERVALDGLYKTVTAYQNALNEAEHMKLAAELPVDIDAFIKIDDNLALRGLETLRLESIPQDSNVAASKTSVISEIQALVGYGGMIHNFKNFVLRGQDKYHKKANANVTNLKAALTRYHNFDLNRGEIVALEDMAQMLNAYHTALNTIHTMIAANRTAEEIDLKVKVDDAPALRAIDFLIHQANFDILAQSSAMDASLQNIDNAERIVSTVETVLLLIIATLFLWVLRQQIIAPLRNTSDNMRHIAEGDYAIKIANLEGSNEISDMARDLQVLLDNSIQRRDAENHLEAANVELGSQLIEVEALREASEQQAVDAVTLAETLAAANTAADIAKTQALAQERRAHSIMNTVMDAIITIDSSGLIETYNIGAQSIFGYAADEMIGRNVSFLMPEPIRSKHDGFIKHFVDGNAARIAGRTVEQVGLRKDNTEFPMDLTINSMYIGDDISFIGVIRDITKRKAAEEEILRLALTDPLTGLANRNAFNTRFDEAITQAKRRGTHLALLMLDLDKFKPVNDEYGHPVGDALLIEVADCLRHICRETDIIARLGGDEFAVILTDLNDTSNAHLPAKKIIKALSSPITVLGKTVQIGASIGIAFFPEHANNEEQLITQADDALYAAKNAGRNTYRLHEN